MATATTNGVATLVGVGGTGELVITARAHDELVGGGGHGDVAARHRSGAGPLSEVGGNQGVPGVGSRAVGDVTRQGGQDLTELQGHGAPVGATDAVHVGHHGAVQRLGIHTQVRQDDVHVGLRGHRGVDERRCERVRKRVLVGRGLGNLVGELKGGQHIAAAIERQVGHRNGSGGAKDCWL